jgi:hypothetical protein
LEPGKKAEYVKPELTRYGNFVQLTRTASGAYSDNNQPNCNHDGPNLSPACGSLNEGGP